ncbi:hypothetical protein ACIGMX_34770 [Streptomyces aquilus]|uniref:hypothetical protein n=1 Tax=Streptomyces aquilus TaxID=2548456 RepID=UPI0037D31A89
MTTPADELKTAATTLRQLTAAIHAPDLTDQAWHTEQCADDEQGNCPCIVAQGAIGLEYGSVPLYYVADAETPELAAYIAAMGPNVGDALADWLDAEARRLAATAHPGWQDVVSPRALAVARAVNATTHTT